MEKIIIPISFVVDSDLPNAKKFKGPNRHSFDMDCPFCDGDRKMNVNTTKNVFRCNRCGQSGNALTLHTLLTKENDRKKALKDLKRRYDGLESSLKVAYSVPEETEPETPIASIGFRDYVYSSLLKELTLSERHHADLIKRGFTEEQIVALGYKSAPETDKQAAEIAEKALEGGFLFKYGNYPGFYLGDDHKPMFVRRRTGGYFIPVKTLEGEISGFQERNDPLPENTPKKWRDRYHKYSWVSSGDKETGSSVSGCENIHFAGDWSINHKVVYLTEGALKADLASVLSGRPFIGLTGVNNLSQLKGNLDKLKKRGLEEIEICVDMDYRDKPAVAKALNNIREIILSCGLKYHTRTWSSEYKGIDDYLYAMKKEKEESKHAD